MYKIISFKDNEDNVWSTKLDIVEKCSKGPEKILVLLEPIVKEKTDLLMDKYNNKEWLAYLIGERGSMVIKDMVIPKQTATSGSVNNISLENYNESNIIGVIHSHHNMGASFSSTDNEWINKNHDISIVVSNSNMYGKVRCKLPCGSIFITEADIKLNLNIEFDRKEFLKDADEKIKEPVFKSIYNSGFNNNAYNYNTGDPLPIIIDDIDDLSLESQLKSLEDNLESIEDQVSSIKDDINDAQIDIYDKFYDNKEWLA